MALTALVLGLDDTLLADREAALRFWEAWLGLATRGFCLIYNTRRRVFDVLERVERCELPIPAFVIGALGTEVHDVQERAAITYFAERIAEDWRGPAVASVTKRTTGVTPGPPTEQSALRHSWAFDHPTDEEIGALEDTLLSAGLKARVIVARARHLDVVPAAAGQGAALEWLRDPRSSARAIVVGSSAADLDMFELRGAQCIALPTLDLGACPSPRSQTVVRVSRGGADGVLDGLRSLGILP
jgi:hydroxymethylpyrimidine pyrophosphatase-like HAD family hydrolase